MSNLIEQIESIVGPKGVLRGEDLTARATSYWDTSPTQAKALVKPSNTEQLAAVVKICHKVGQAIVTQGGLTGCVVGAVSSPEQVIVSLERMNAVEHIDPVGRTVTTQAGVVLETLQKLVAEEGLIFPLDLGARGSCTIGGNIATNAGGINVLRYGMTRALVLGLEVVTAQGEVLSSMNQMLKNNAGYDLKQMFIGSEGTLGIVTRAVLRLFPAPATCSTALVACSSFDEVVNSLNRFQAELAGNLSAFEVMWGDYFSAVTGVGAHRSPIAREYPFYVLIEAEGADSDGDYDRFESVLANAMEAGLFLDAVICKSESERREVWNIREEFDAILPSYLYDISLPIIGMDSYVDALKISMREKWKTSECYAFGHIADGNLHLFLRTGESLDLHAVCDELVYKPLASHGGSISAEHGIGTEKRRWLSLSRSQEELAMMRLLKQSLDPKGILNPGCIL